MLFGSESVLARRHLSVSSTLSNTNQAQSCLARSPPERCPCLPAIKIAISRLAGSSQPQPYIVILLAEGQGQGREACRLRGSSRHSSNQIHVMTGSTRS